METTWLWSLLVFLSVPLFVAMNGLFVAAEFALVALRKKGPKEGQRGRPKVGGQRAKGVGSLCS